MHISIYPGLSRRIILEKYAAYAIDMEQREGSRGRSFLYKPILNIFNGEYNSKKFKTNIDQLKNKHKNMLIGDLILKSMEIMSCDVLDSL